MPFPTVKTNPWKKRARRRQPLFRLWSDKDWAEIVRMVEEGEDWFGFMCWLNTSYYGKALTASGAGLGDER